MQKTYNIEGMHCASCVANVEKSLKSVPGVVNAVVNLALKNATVSMESEVPVSSLISHLDKIGYTLIDNPVENLSQRQNREITEWKFRFIYTAILGIPFLIYSMTEFFFFPGKLPVISFLIKFFLVTPILLIGRLNYIHGLKSPIHKHQNMNSLVGMGTVAPNCYSLITS